MPSPTGVLHLQLHFAAQGIIAKEIGKLRTRMETEFRLTAEGRRRQFLRVEVSDSGRGMNAASHSPTGSSFGVGGGAWAATIASRSRRSFEEKYR